MNKNFTLTLLIAAAMIGFTMSANAQTQASVNTQAEVILPISVAGNTELNFGSIVITGAAGTVSVDTAGKRTSTDAGMIVSTGGVTAAQFTVTGQAGYTYSLALPSAAFNLTNSLDASTMSVDGFVSTLTSTGNAGTLSSTDGTQVVNIGANLSVAATQTPGVYANSNGLAVTVQYN